MNIQTLKDGLAKLQARYNELYTAERSMLLAEAYFDMLKQFDDHVFLTAIKFYDGEKFPTAVQLLKKCRDVRERRKVDVRLDGTGCISKICQYELNFSHKIDISSMPGAENVACFDISDRDAAESFKYFGCVLCYFHDNLVKFISGVGNTSRTAVWFDSMIRAYKNNNTSQNTSPNAHRLVSTGVSSVGSRIG